MKCHIISGLTLLVTICCVFLSTSLLAHGVDENTQAFLSGNQGVSILPFVYIGAKHMVTGYDHLLFLVGVIFFLFRGKDIVIYVSLFTLGHSITLLFGVLNDVQVNAYLIDAIIGLSIVYKGFDNLGGFRRLFGRQPNTQMAVAIFGLFHGFGLATKIQEFQLPREGLVSNILAFNLGVEIGQFLALGVIFLLISFWRQHRSYLTFSLAANTLLMSSGLMLAGYQLTGYFQ
ncbi:membrane protein [Shewanella colwelliana]|uniref:Membrane protein n=1 Tax=Shewanella colwelliana TaxID=23 RepID=A0ABQ4NYB8_SHECO|nr:HupE/UreJ family protein [Shewanella colwelliana]MDX1281769.1 HupE/UreJ family protein [Shewanella colwelliana]GIU22090.1 membrane protein [Shewanella colwelliana]GIU39880.1 membrane protein [Shewanella colwelliana]